MTFSKKFIYIFLLSFFIFLLLLIFYFKTTSNTEVNMKELQTETKETQTETAYTENTLPEPEFYQEAISESLKETMTGKSYTPNDNITFDNLRHVVVSYIDFDGNTRSGELVVNEAVADDVVEIFKELYEAAYPIEKIRLIDEYNGDDDESMGDNNSSCFNYRTIDGQTTLSDHSYGLAIDINPLYNPYVRTGMGQRNVLPVNGQVYADRTSDFPHKITHDDVCYQIFTKHGWLWGGDWDSPVDYQHFYREL